MTALPRVVCLLVFFGLLYAPQTFARRPHRAHFGEWGGMDISMNIHATHALIMFDCARGTIDSSIFLDEQGSFDITGIFIREGPGPVAVPPLVHPARYSGQVHRSTMSLTVTLIDTGEILGPFTLMHGQPGQLFACP